MVKPLRGAATAKSFEYSTYWCCGSRLEVGNYYAAILDEVPTTSFFGHAGNLLLIGDAWEGRTKLLRRVLAGNLTFEQAFGEFQVDIRKPPPPPSPCPKVEPEAMDSNSQR